MERESVKRKPTAKGIRRKENLLKKNPQKEYAQILDKEVGSKGDGRPERPEIRKRKKEQICRQKTVKAEEYVC